MAAREKLKVQGQSYIIPGPKGSEKLMLEPPVGRYTSGDPCGSARKGCPVQLFTKDNRHYLRFCLRAGNKQPGWMVPVESADHARELASKACAAWKRDRRRFTEKNPAVVAAKKARAGSGREAALGRFR